MRMEKKLALAGVNLDPHILSLDPLHCSVREKRRVDLRIFFAKHRYNRLLRHQEDEARREQLRLLALRRDRFFSDFTELAPKVCISRVANQANGVVLL